MHYTTPGKARQSPVICLVSIKVSAIKSVSLNWGSISFSSFIMLSWRKGEGNAKSHTHFTYHWVKNVHKTRFTIKSMSKFKVNARCLLAKSDFGTAENQNCFQGTKPQFFQQPHYALFFFSSLYLQTKRKRCNVLENSGSRFTHYIKSKTCSTGGMKI